MYKCIDGISLRVYCMCESVQTYDKTSTIGAQRTKKCVRVERGGSASAYNDKNDSVRNK